jgi:pyruvate dehydrogenase E1 component
MRYLSTAACSTAARARSGACSATARWTSPRAMSALTLAAREGLDNLVWVVNCNLQRLDGPVRGNGRIIDELERLFAGAGWNVIKLVWGSDWDGLFARDTRARCCAPSAHTVDGQMQTFAAKDGASTATLLRPERRNWRAGAGHDRRADRPPQARRARPGEDPRRLCRGGRAPRPADRDPGAHQEGLRHGQRRPGPHDHAQQKKLDDAGPARVPRPLQAAAERRAGHHWPSTSPPTTAPRCATCTRAAPRWAATMPQRSRPATCCRCPRWPATASSRWGGGKEMSTTMAFVRMLGNAAEGRGSAPASCPSWPTRRAPSAWPTCSSRWASTAASGQRYAPEDIGSVLSYREATGRADPGRRHQRSRRHRQLDGRGHQLQRARPGHAAVLHLLLDVRLPARGRRHLGRRRPARARLPAGRHLGPHHAGRRRACSTRTAAATWWPPPSPTAAPTTRPSRASWR